MQEIIGLLVFAIIVGIGALSWYNKRKKTMSYFESLGIAGPKPHLIKGSLPEIFRKGVMQWSKDCVQKYGKIFGFYFGGQPVLFIADPDLMKQIQVKDFQNFYLRETPFPGGIFPDKLMFDALPLMNGARWKVTRTTLSPTFTMSKMNWMAEDVKEPVARLLNIIKDHADNNKAFDIYPYFRRLTFDHWMRILFGVKTNALDRKDSEAMFQDTKESVSYFYEKFTLLGAYFPEFKELILPLRNLEDSIKYWWNKPSNQGLFEKAKLFIKARSNSSQTFRKDIVKLMMDGRKTLKSIYQDQKDEDDFFKDYEQFKKRALFGMDQMKANAALFHIAGFENISILLAFALRFLVHHPEIQVKMKKEIDQVLEEHGGEYSYDVAFNLVYCDQVLFETLRLFPLVNVFTTRTAVDDYEYGDLKIPKGTVTFAGIEEMHRNTDYWDDPEKFDPDRFTPEKKADLNLYVYQPFGIGPRHCIGQRISLMLGRLLLGYLLKDYRYVPCEKTEAEDGPVGQKLFQIFPETLYVKPVPWDSK